MKCPFEITFIPSKEKPNNAKLHKYFKLAELNQLDHNHTQLLVFNQLKNLLEFHFRKYYKNFLKENFVKNIQTIKGNLQRS